VISDTEAGVVETVARSDRDRVREVTLRWTPSFVVLAGQSVEVDSVGEVPVDVAVGVGNVFAIVEAQALGVGVRRELAKRIAQRGMAVREAVNAQLEVNVPGPRQGQTSTTFSSTSCRTAGGVSPNALVWGPGQVDAAPLRIWNLRAHGAASTTAVSCAWAGASRAGGSWVSTSRAASPAKRWSRAGERSFRRSPARRTSRASASSSSIPATRCGPASSSRRDPMKTLVLGGGRGRRDDGLLPGQGGPRGHDPRREDALGLEASSGNAGIIAPGHSFAWASPRAPRMLWDSLRGGETGDPDPADDRPSPVHVGAPLPARVQPRTERVGTTLIKLRLCQYSQSVMNDLVRAEQIEYHAITRGALYHLPR